VATTAAPDTLDLREQHFSPWAWTVTAYPAAKEAVVSVQPTERPPRSPSDKPVDHERAEYEARRRATTKVRRLCVENGLDRLWTLTYRVEPAGDEQVKRDVGVFMEKMRERFPRWAYLYVVEHGSKSGRLHAHFATNAFVPKSAVAACWPHGFVDGRRLTSGRAGDARAAATYLAKYVSKPDGELRHRRRSGRRYVPGLMLKHTVVRILVRSEHHAEVVLAEMMGGAPNYVWRSCSAEDWRGPPCTVAWWPVRR